MSRSERGTTNDNTQDSSYEQHRAWIMEVWASNKPGLVRCYRCGVLLYNPDDYPEGGVVWVPRDETLRVAAHALTIDRIVPGCQGGTYRRGNIRPACEAHNLETGGYAHRKGTS